MNKIDIRRATDADLLARFDTARDCRAFEVLIGRYGAMVRATARRCVDQESDVEDAFQATFFALAKLSGKLKKKAAVAGWLQKTARNISVDIVREQARWQRGAARMTENLEKRRNESNDHADPSKNAADVELKQVLDEEVARLSESLRDAVVLCDLQGMTQKEAAKLLAISVSTVNERVAKARRLLRERLIRRGVTLTVAGLATCVASSTEEVSAIVVRGVAKNATLYAAGKVASEIGVGSSVTQSANKVILTMTKAKLLSVALLATTVLLFAGFINGLVHSSGGVAQAGTIFIDDFSDGDYADGKPVSWIRDELTPGIFEATTEGLLMRPDGAPVASLGADIPRIKDISMRGQVRVSGIGAAAVMTVRDNGATGYAAVVGYDPGLGGSFLVVGAATGEIAQLSYFQNVNGQLTSRLPFDVRTTDALVQLDVFGNELRVWAWETGNDRPDQPQFEVIDDTWTEAGQTGILFTTSPGSPAGIERSATFRFVHVSTRSIPEPASAQLAFFGVASLGLLIRKRRRLG